MIKAVIFDMDGVLIDSEPIYQEIEGAIYKELGIEVSQELMLESLGMVVEEWWEKIFGRFNIDKDPKEYGELENKRYLDYLNDSSIPKIPMEGAKELMRDLKAKGIKLALASSSGIEAIEKICEIFDYSQYLDVKISGTQVEKGKPAPDIFLRAAELLEIHPKHCLVVEDSYNGIKGAIAAEMTCAAYLSAGEEVDTSAAHYQYSNHHEFMNKINLN